MVLYKTKQQIKVDKVTICFSKSTKLSLILGQFEAKWNNVQKQTLKKKTEMKLRKAVQAKDYVMKLLQECKTWGGPCTTADELCDILIQKPDQERVIVRTEMAFFALSHKAEKIARPSLFCLNSISHEEKLENLLLLLSDDDGYATK